MVRMTGVHGKVVDFILPHAEFGPNDYREDAPPFTSPLLLTHLFLYYLGPDKINIRISGFTIERNNKIINVGKIQFIKHHR